MKIMFRRTLYTHNFGIDFDMGVHYDYLQQYKYMIWIWLWNRVLAIFIFKVKGAVR